MTSKITALIECEDKLGKIRNVTALVEAADRLLLEIDPVESEGYELIEKIIYLLGLFRAQKIEETIREVEKRLEHIREGMPRDDIE